MEKIQLFFDARQYASNLRCTIQRTGKMGFSEFTQVKLQLKEGMSIKIGIDGSREDYKHLLLKLMNTVDETAFRVNKAGNYYYINPKPLLDELGIEYKSRNVLYEMVCLDETERIYKLVKKEVKVIS
jgi:hypothetical protein